MEIISKELLIEVLDEDVEKVGEALKDFLSFTDIKNDLLKVWINGNFYFLNIHQLAHKCKECASNQKEVIYIDVAESVKSEVVEIKIATNFRLKEAEKYEVYNKIYYNEKILTPKHIFEYCQWILDNKKVNK